MRLRRAARRTGTPSPPPGPPGGLRASGREGRPPPARRGRGARCPGRPWRRRSPLWFFLTARWLWHVLLSRGRWYSSSRRTSRLVNCARTSFSRTASLAGSSAARQRIAGIPQVRRGSLFSPALLVSCPAKWRRSTESLPFRCSAASLRRNIFLTTTRNRTLS